MGETTEISWTDATFNPWVGCTKVSDGCKFCYAEELMDKRYGKVEWGPTGTRVRTSAANWKQPIRWSNQKWSECVTCQWRGALKDVKFNDTSYRLACPKCGGEVKPTRMRVFCASLADVFEDRPELAEWRADLLAMIFNTPNLDWLLLTKRPENILRQVEEAGAILQKAGNYAAAKEWLTWVKHGEKYAPNNVWLGTSVEDQDAADKRIPHLLEIPAKVRFLSMEPLLGPVSFSKVPGFNRIGLDLRGWWVIVGGESGSKARPMNPAWVRSLRDQCSNADVPFHFKQWGEWVSVSEVAGPGAHYKFPDGRTVRKVGKHAAGRTLDGQIHSAFPETR